MLGNPVDGIQVVLVESGPKVGNDSRLLTVEDSVPGNRGREEKDGVIVGKPDDAVTGSRIVLPVLRLGDG